MRLVWDNSRPITVAVHHLSTDMIWGGATTKSFTGLLLILVIWWVPECFVEVGVGISRATTQITNISIKRQGYTTTAREGYQEASLCAPKRLEHLWNVFDTGVGDDRGKPVWKSGSFSVNLGGHRPPRRININTARNNYWVNIMTMHFNSYLNLVEIYW